MTLRLLKIEELKKENEALRKANDSALELAYENDELINENRLLTENLQSMNQTNQALIKKLLGSCEHCHCHNDTHCVCGKRNKIPSCTPSQLTL